MGRDELTIRGVNDACPAQGSKKEKAYIETKSRIENKIKEPTPTMYVGVGPGVMHAYV